MFNGDVSFQVPWPLVGGNPRSKSFWSPVVERVEKRLERWSGKYLSLGGGLTLIRSVLMNQPTYYMSLFQIPKGISVKLEQCFRRFLWGDKQDKRKVDLVSWSNVTKPKERGGLGITPLHLRNQALLCKWNWRFGKEREALWATVLTSRYRIGERGGWTLGDRVEREGS